MLRTTIYTIALGTFALASGANAVSLQNQQLATKSSNISHTRLAQFPGPGMPQMPNFPGMPQMPNFPGQGMPQRPNSPGQGMPQRPNSPGQGMPQRPNSPGQGMPQRPNSPGQGMPQRPNSPGQGMPQSGQPAPQSGQPKSQGEQSNSNTASIEQAVFDQINQYRASQNLPALKRNSAIDEQARGHSQNMASGQVPFSHQGFEQRKQAIGIPHKTASENVAYNHDRDAATRAVQGWLQSQSHLANIQGNYDLTGIGVATNSQGAVYLTQIFLRS